MAGEDATADAVGVEDGEVFRRRAGSGSRGFGQVAAYASAAQAEAAGVALDARPLRHGDIAIAAISSCTNTSNPFQIIAAGLLARNAVARGLRAKPWVKTSLSPGSRVVTSMLQRAGLQDALDAAGFTTVGYGCMTCGGGAGPLPAAITDEVASRDLVVLGVISTNRNFEGRLHPAIRGTYLASPPMVVACTRAAEAERLSTLHGLLDLAPIYAAGRSRP